LNDLTNRGDDTALASAWQETLKAKDLLEPLSRFARVVRLPSEVRSELAQLKPDLIEPHTRYLDRIESFLSQGFNQNVKWAKSVLREAVMYSLEQCSATLSTEGPQPVIENEQLEAFRQDFLAARQEVHDDLTLDERSRAALLDRIDDLLDSLLFYETDGALEISKSAHVVVGLASACGWLVSFLRQSEERPLPRGGSFQSLFRRCIDGRRTMFIETITAPTEEWEDWQERLGMRDPPEAVVALIARDSGGGQVTQVAVWDNPAAIADFYMERIRPIVEAEGEPDNKPQRHGEPLTVYLRAQPS